MRAGELGALKVGGGIPKHPPAWVSSEDGSQNRTGAHTCALLFTRAELLALVPTHILAISTSAASPPRLTTTAKDAGLLNINSINSALLN